MNKVDVTYILIGQSEGKDRRPTDNMGFPL